MGKDEDDNELIDELVAVKPELDDGEYFIIIKREDQLSSKGGHVYLTSSHGDGCGATLHQAEQFNNTQSVLLRFSKLDKPKEWAIMKCKVKFEYVAQFNIEDM